MTTFSPKKIIKTTFCETTTVVFFFFLNMVDLLDRHDSRCKIQKVKNLGEFFHTDGKSSQPIRFENQRELLYEIR